MINNESNFERRKINQKSRFWDDCGSWVSGPTNYTNLLPDSQKQYITVIMRNGQYCIRQRKSKNGIKTQNFTPLQPQPKPEEIIRLHRSYATHAISSGYKRRISWLSNPEVKDCRNALAEYVGQYPGQSTHWNSKVERKYIRLLPSAMDHLKQRVREGATNVIYQDEIIRNPDPMSSPRSRKQVENAKYRQKRGNTQEKRANFADHVVQIENLVLTHPCVQMVIHAKEKVPSVILYTAEQLQNVARFCCSSPTAETTVLGFDKTYNLGQVHVTVAAFKHLAVWSRRVQPL